MPVFQCTAQKMAGTFAGGITEKWQNNVSVGGALLKFCIASGVVLSCKTTILKQGTYCSSFQVNILC
jgi:hypothetical protein